jgi:hypothetical protein
VLLKKDSGQWLFNILSSGKPLTRKTKSELTELIREKREELDEDDRSSEMQKFMLDLSSKEDMSRLRERWDIDTLSML